MRRVAEGDVLYPQVSRLEQAKEGLQADMAGARAKLAALEARFQQHLAECSGRQAAAAAKEAGLELACRQARTEANTARCACHTESEPPFWARMAMPLQL